MVFTSSAKVSIPSHEAATSLRRSSTLCNQLEKTFSPIDVPNRISLFLKGKNQSTSVPVPHNPLNISLSLELDTPIPTHSPGFPRSLQVFHQIVVPQTLNVSS